MEYRCKYALIFSTFLQNVIGNLRHPNFERPHTYVSGMYNVYMSGRPSINIYGSLLNYNSKLTECGIGGEFTVPMARHHIISLYILYTFYNKMMSRGHYYKLSRFWSSLGEHLPFYVDLENSDRDWETIIHGVYKLLLGFKFNLITPAYPPFLSPPFFDEFKSFYSGIPGNLFIGPANRLDDPRYKFETNAITLLGRRRYRVLRTVYNLMTRYIDGRDDIDWETLERGLVEISSYREPMRLIPGQWAQAKDGRYYIIRNSTRSNYNRRLFERDVYYDFQLGHVIDQCIQESIYYRYLEKSVKYSLYAPFSDTEYASGM